MKKTNITLSIALAAVFSSSVVFAEAEVTGKIVHESAKFTTSGTTIGAAAAHGKDVMKTETSARIYIDGDAEELQEGATYHVELNLMSDSKGVGKHDGNESYTQRDALREAYVDTEVNDWSIRAGKQQVVWGKADGMKLLDMINPTDYSEMAQNQMEDSRIPVWMVNSEKTLEDGSSFQVVVSQPRENIFAGLNRNVSTSTRSNTLFATDAYTNETWSNGSNFSQWNSDTAAISNDAGQPFILKGVDSITGKENGFLNVVPDLGSVAALFGRAFAMNGADTTNYASSGYTAAADDHQAGLAPSSHGGAHTGFTVGNFNTSTTLASFSGQFVGGTSNYINGDNTGATGYGFEETNLGTAGYWLDDDGSFADGVENSIGDSAAASTAGDGWSGASVLGAFASKFGTNLNNTTTTAVDSAFEYMDRASFATFDAFVNAKSEYVYDMPSDGDANAALRFNNTTEDGLNYSLAYSNNYDANPVIKLSWRDKNGAEVSPTRAAGYFTVDTDSDQVADKVFTTYITLAGIGGGASETAGADTEIATLRMTETMERAQNIGGALDYSLETESMGPVVIRAEGLYQKGVYSPIVDRGAMSIGDITNALKMTKGDRFKYVLGADATFLTNMMVSAQFIQDRNLDYIDSNLDWDGSVCDSDRTGATNAAAYLDNCGSYTADFASMHMSNGFNKAEENKEFYSLFLSKPFGASGEHRWNNIFMFEENGGKWNRLDAEFSIDDDTQATVEYNKYWGDANTQFGQLEKSSNIQVGVKYSF